MDADRVNEFIGALLRGLVLGGAVAAVITGHTTDALLALGLAAIAFTVSNIER